VGCYTVVSRTLTAEALRRMSFAYLLNCINATRLLHACDTCMSFSEPESLITRFMLWALTCRLISVFTCAMVRVRKWVAPIHALIVPKGCSTVCRQIRIIPGAWSSRAHISSTMASCSQHATRH
jgi:hypothetical protein